MCSQLINEIVQGLVVAMVEEIEARITTQIETLMAMMEDKMEKIHRASWKRNEPMLEKEEEEEDVSNYEETDDDKVFYVLYIFS